MKVLSVIIPVYRAKKTLFRLLKSISDSNISDFASLVLVFDKDGVDYAEEIAFARSFIETKTIFLDENLGPGLARQAGINGNASKFIMFADADDFFLPEALNKIVSKLNELKTDILITAFRYERDGEVKILENDFTWLHGKIYLRSFLSDNKIYFNSYCANEDNGFNRLCLLYKPKLTYDNTLTYVYSENSESITRRDNRLYKFTGLEFLAKNLVWAANEYLKNCKNCDYKAVASLLFCLLMSMYYYYLDFFGVYDVDKILFWSKESLELYEKYCGCLCDKDVGDLATAYEKAYPKVIKRLSFEDFLAKVKDVK